MRRHYRVMQDHESGHPFARIDHSDMWELVEFLSICRTDVTYSYQDDYFTVLFLRLDEKGAQELLDQWASESSQTEVLVDFDNTKQPHYCY